MSSGELILYRSDDGAQMQLRAPGGSVWLTQAERAELYGTSVPNIAQIIRRVLADGEADEATVNSGRAPFDRSASSKHGCCAFFAKVQNKMLSAVTGHTAAEIVALRSDPIAANMGLTSWSGMVVRKGDVAVGKNYLASDEVKEVDLIVTMYLDFAELQAKSRRAMTMKDWEARLHAFLQFKERALLTHTGCVRADIAKALAEERYAEFDAARKRCEALDADHHDAAAVRELEQKLGDDA